MDTKTLERFWAKVNKTEGCWVWTGAKYTRGYGVFAVRHGNLMSAHRFSYQVAYGTIAAGKNVCHTCDTPECVRPDHLFLGTQLDNARDAARKGRVRNGGRAGEKNNRSKLTQAQVEEIRAAYATGVFTQRFIAQSFGIGQSQVSAIIRGVRW